MSDADHDDGSDGGRDEGSPSSEAQPAEAGTPSDGALIGRGLLDEEMGPSSALAHLYRAEVHRMKFWRERLDRTTNWAVILMAAVLTWAFSSESNPHYVLLVGVAAVAVFLVIEARRYRGYDMWRNRVRILQENVFAYGLDEAAGLADADWREALADDYRAPTMTMTTEEAVAHRLRRVYLALFAVLLAAWVVRITAFADASWPASAAVGRIPGTAVSAAVAGYVLLLLVVAFRPRDWQGELLEAESGEYRRHDDR